jgi:hypothetical protein
VQGFAHLAMGIFRQDLESRVKMGLLQTDQEKRAKIFPAKNRVLRLSVKISKVSIN